MTAPTLAAWLLEQIAADEARWGNPALVRLAGPDLSEFVLRTRAECEAKRQIIALHESWPVRFEKPVEFTVDPTDISGMTMRATQQMAWLTTQEYRARFGDEPPTTAILAALALPYADRPGYDEGWRP